MKFSIEDRRILIGGFILLAVAALFFSLKYETAGTVLSVLGSIASLYAIVEALFRIKTIKEETHTIQTALNQKVHSLNLKETTEQINKKIQIVSRIQDFISIRNHEAAVVLMEQLLVFLQSLKCNPTTEAEVANEIQKYIKILNSDIRNLRAVFGLRVDVDEPGVKYPLITKHFTDLEEYLTSVSQQNHFKHDQ